MPASPPAAPAEPFTMSGSSGVTRTRPLTEVPELAERAAALLRTRNATHDLTPAEARCVVGYMRLVYAPRGAALFLEGDRMDTGTMLLILEGEVSVDMSDGVAGDSVPLSVAGPGQLLGEMALLDGAPRAATCKVLSPVQAAGLSRQGLQRLIDEHPQVGAKLMVGVAQRIGDRLRALGDQLRIYAKLVADQQAQIAQLGGRPR